MPAFALDVGVDDQPKGKKKVPKHLCGRYYINTVKNLSFGVRKICI